MGEAAQGFLVAAGRDGLLGVAECGAIPAHEDRIKDGKSAADAEAKAEKDADQDWPERVHRVWSVARKGGAAHERGGAMLFRRIWLP